MATKRLPKLYRLADKTIALLTRREVTRFGRAHNVIWGNGFDELNVIQTTKQLYTQLSEDNRELWTELFDSVYGYYLAMYGGEPRPKKGRREVNRLLSSYNQMSKYIYDNEVVRKRDRTTEAVLSASSREIEKVWKTSLRLWASATRLYTDCVAYQAHLDAMRDAGIKEVRWVTEADDRVCDDCKPLHGQVFPIDKVPEKPHIGCRCWLQPVGK